MTKQEDLLKIFSLTIRDILRPLALNMEQLQEIRLRALSPLLLIYQNKESFVSKHGSLTKDPKDAYYVTKNEIRETMEYISNFSLYAYEEEIKQGFLTIQGGHRIGLAGKVIMEQDKVKSMKYISFINVRLAHQIRGCADLVMHYIRNQNNVCHTLIISPPRCGKTTLLRDIIRQISDGEIGKEGMTVGVVDERSEIGACYMGIPQNEVGIRTDILDCCPKAQGMLMLIRTMSPQVIAVDEIGSTEDIESMEYAMNCGCKMLATVHGSSIEEIQHKPVLQKLIKNHMFERYILLNNHHYPGDVQAIFDTQGNPLYQKEVYHVN